MYFLLLLESELFFMNFIVQKNYYILKHKQIIIVRDVKDTERHIHYKKENEKYNTILVNRSRKNELRRTKRKVKNNELRNIKKMIEDKNSLVIKNNVIRKTDEQDQILYQHFKRQKEILLYDKTRKSTNVSLNLLKNNQYNLSVTSLSSYLDTKNIEFYRLLNKEV